MVNLFGSFGSILLIVAVAFLAFVGGYILRKAKAQKMKRRIYELENEMMNNHAEILRLTKELSRTASAATSEKAGNAPVITLSASKDGSGKSVAGQ
jgi:type II secretory pathway component PulM